MRIKFYFVFIFSLCALVTKAQSIDTLWTLEKCIDFAFQNNISIKQSILSSESSKVTLQQSQYNRIPTVSANASQGFSDGRSLDPTLNTYVNRSVRSNNFNVSGNLVLFNGLQVTHQIAQNRMTYEASEMDVEAARSNLILNILQSYYNVLLAQEQVDNAVLQVETTKSDIDRSKKLVNAGSAPELNVLQLEAQLANDNLNLINSKNQVYLRKVDLMQLMNLPISENFAIVKPEDAQIVSIAVVTENSQTLYDQSLLVQPSIKSLSLRKEGARLGVKVAKGTYYPRLSMGGQVFTNYSNARMDPFGTQLNNNFAKTLSFNLSIPIINARQNRSAVDRSVISLKQSELLEENGKIQLRQQVETAYANLRSSENAYGASRQSMEVMELTYKNSERRFALGIMSPYDFIIQKNNYFTSKYQYSQSKYQFILNAKILEFYKSNKL